MLLRTNRSCSTRFVKLAVIEARTKPRVVGITKAARRDRLSAPAKDLLSKPDSKSLATSLGRRAFPDAAVQSARAFAVNGEVLRPHLSSSGRLGSLLL
jgi:hypothetical protein